MRILVTGGAGFIGTNLIIRLVKEGHHVTSVDDYSTGSTKNHIGGVFYINQSVGSLLLEGQDKFDIIYHLAASSRIQPSFNNPQATFISNVWGTQRVLDYARETNTKVVYAGSSSKWHNPEQSPYATSKYLGEELCKMYRKVYNLKVEIVRFYNVYGPYEIINEDMGAVIGKWRYQVNNKLPLTIVGDGEQKRDFTHVDDIVEGLYRVGLVDNSHKDAWELGTGINYSINDLYLMFKERFGVDYKKVPEQKGNYRATIRVNDDTLEQLGWKPSDKLKDYIFSLDKD